MTCQPYNLSVSEATRRDGGNRGDLNYRAALATREAVARLPSRQRRVTVLPFFDESSRRFNMHPGATCKGKGHCFADCLHWCYTPQFLDTSLFTPLFRGLQQVDRTWSRVEWAAAAAEGGAATRAVDKNSSARRQCVEPSIPPCWGNSGLGVYWHNKWVVGRAASEQSGFTPALRAESVLDFVQFEEGRHAPSRVRKTMELGYFETAEEAAWSNASSPEKKATAWRAALAKRHRKVG